jgi:HTH-type transcriptional regulator/antitoxin HigA
MSTILANPAEMIAHGAPRLIHTNKELEAYTESLFLLTSLARPTRPQKEAIQLLTLLIETYERKRYPIAAADPVSVVRFLMDQQGLTQRDLMPQFGTESAVSMFLSGQRSLSLTQVRKLALRFELPADTFLHLN